MPFKKKKMGSKVIALLILLPRRKMGCVVKATSRPLYPQERDPVPIVKEAGWAPGPVWTGAENLANTDIRSPVAPGRSESLYRLSYRSPQILLIVSGLMC
jgi:hypothetical protein